MTVPEKSPTLVILVIGITMCPKETFKERQSKIELGLVSFHWLCSENSETRKLTYILLPQHQPADQWVQCQRKGRRDRKPMSWCVHSSYSYDLPAWVHTYILHILWVYSRAIFDRDASLCGALEWKRFTLLFPLGSGLQPASAGDDSLRSKHEETCSLAFSTWKGRRALWEGGATDRCAHQEECTCIVPMVHTYILACIPTAWWGCCTTGSIQPKA